MGRQLPERLPLSPDTQYPAALARVGVLPVRAQHSVLRADSFSPPASAPRPGGLPSAAESAAHKPRAARSSREQRSITDERVK